MSDFLIQTIDLDNIPVDAIAYGCGLERYMIDKALSAEDVANIACATPEEIHHLIAGTSEQANALAGSLWIRGQIHVESMILEGANFFAGDHADKVMVA